MSAISNIKVPDGTTYELKDASALRASAAAPAFSASSAYAVGDVCSYGGLVYRCTAAHSAGAWNAAHFTAVGALQSQLDGKESTANKVTSLSSSSTDAQYPSAKCMWTIEGNIEAVLDAILGGDTPSGGGGGLSPYTSNPAMDGTASAGSSSDYARGDHVHPTDTTRQAKITASGLLKGDGTGGVSAAEAGTDYQAPLSAYTSNPAMDGTASAGSSTAYAKGDHVHPIDTSREAVSNKVTSLSSSSTDNQYPSAKCVWDIVGNVASALAAINGGTPS